MPALANGTRQGVGRKPWTPRGEPSKSDFNLAILLAAGAEYADIADARGISVNQVAKAAERLRWNMRARTTVEAVWKLSRIDPGRFDADTARARRILEAKFSPQISVATG